MNYRLGKNYADGFLLLPESVLDHTNEAGEDEIKILLHAASYLRSGPLSEEEILEGLEEIFEREKILTALAFWRGCGVLSTDGKKAVRRVTAPKKAEEPIAEEKTKEEKKIDADEAPFYTTKDLADAAEQNADFKNLVAFTEARLEKVLNVSELARLWSFLDYLKMPFDVVMLVVEDSVSRGKKSLRYITKMLTSFQDDGIDTYEKAEAYFAARQESAKFEKYVRGLFGLGDRKLTGAEEEILKTWRTVFLFEEEMLEAAYERTVASAKTPTLRYMNKILESWHKDGITTVDAIGTKKKSEMAEKSYDLEGFFEQAVSKGRKEL